MSLYIYPACIALYIQKPHIIVKHTPGARFIKRLTTRRKASLVVTLGQD